MNLKKAKQFRKWAKAIAKGEQETVYQTFKLPLNTPRAKARWAGQGWAPVVHVSPDCARGIYLQMKRSS